MLDLCRFKEVNDTLGHEVGDQVLREVARRFESVADRGGFVARLGGDEFTLVLEQTAPNDDIVEIASILHESLREPIPAAGIAIDVGVSIGIARYPDDAKDPATLLRHADVAMYVAKRRQTRFEMYDPANDRNTVRRLAMVGELRSAIANGQLRLYYQPKINFRTRPVRQRRSADALAAPGIRVRQPRGIHRARRIDRPDPAVDRMDPRRARWRSG